MQYDPALITQTITALRAIGNPALRVDQIARCARHAVDDPAIVKLATAEIMRAMPRDCVERRAALAKLNYETPTFPIIQPTVTRAAVEQRLEALQLLDDPELLRIYVGLRYAIQITVWSAARVLARRAGGAGWVEIDQLVEALLKHGMEVDERTIRRHWISKGEGIFWRTVGSRLYLTGYKKLCERAITDADAAGLPDLVSTNPPGARFVEIPLGKNKLEFGAYALAAWHNSRGNHTQNISRAVLELLWNTCKKTLISWEKAVGIDTTKCYAQYFDDDYIPVKHAYPTLHTVRQDDGTSTVQVRASARHSNIYHPPSMKEHQHKRTPREARRNARRALDILTQDGIRNGIYGQPEAKADGVAIKPTKRRNFYAPDGDLLAAFKRLGRHVRSHDEQAPHYVQIEHNRRHDFWMFEQSSDGIHRSTANDRAPRHIEDAYFAAHGGRSLYIAAWRECEWL